MNEAIVTKLQNLEDLIFTQLNKFGDATENIKTIKDEIESLKRDLFNAGGKFVGEKAQQMKETVGVSMWDYITGKEEPSKQE